MNLSKETPVETSDSGYRIGHNGGGRLQTGNPGNRGGGRPKSEFRERRDQWLDSLLSSPCDTGATFGDKLKEVIRDAVTAESPDLSTARWVAEMAFGGRGSKIDIVVDRELFEVACRQTVLLCHEYGVPREAFDKWLEHVTAELPDPSALASSIG